MNQGPGSSPSGHGRLEEGRSARRRAERRQRSRRLARALIPAVLAVIVTAAVAVLSSPLVPTSAKTPDGLVSTVTTSVSSATTALEKVAGSALLVITQDKQAAIIALLCAGPKGGAVLGMPAATLLRSGESFAVLSQAYAAGGPAGLPEPVSEALSVPESAVAVIEWPALRSALSSGSGADFPESLDPRGADAAAVAVVLGAVTGSVDWWQRAAFSGDAERFREALAAEAKAAGGSPWKGAALAGQLVEAGDGTSYFEPDVQAARAFLAATGATSGAGSGN